MNNRRNRWRTDRNGEPKSIACRVLDILICIAVVVLVFRGLVLGYDIVDEMRGYAPGTSSLHYAYMDEEYARLARYVMDYPELEKKKENSEYAAVGKYYRDCLIYQGFLAAGNTEQAEKMEQQLENDANEMGSLYDAKGKIDSRLKRE